MLNHEYFMRLALQQAQEAFDAGEVPVGAIVVHKDLVIAKAYNQVEQLNDVTAHAEILCITAAAEYIGSKYLQDCILYVTLEPCLMCAGGLYWSQVSTVVYGASDKKRGFVQMQQPVLHPKTEIIPGILAPESAALLKAFFRGKR